MKKRFLITAVFISFLLAFNALSSSQPARIQQAQRSFARNRTEMTAIAEGFAAGGRVNADAASMRGVQRITVHQNPDWLEFQTEAFGLASASVYSGVYFSPTDEAMHPNMGGGDNRWHTQRICENWYYYEASF